MEAQFKVPAEVKWECCCGQIGLLRDHLAGGSGTLGALLRFTLKQPAKATERWTLDGLWANLGASYRQVEMWRVETTVYIQGNNRKTSAGWSTPEECWPHSGDLLCWVAAERQSQLNRFLWQRHKVHNNKGPLPTGGRHPVCFFFLYFFSLGDKSRREEQWRLLCFCSILW